MPDQPFTIQRKRGLADVRRRDSGALIGSVFAVNRWGDWLPILPGGTELHTQHSQTAAAQLLFDTSECQLFNERYPIGTAVTYWTGAREGAGRTSTTRSTAEVLSGHTPVVWVDGHSGCIALSHVEPLT